MNMSKRMLLGVSAILCLSIVLIGIIACEKSEDNHHSTAGVGSVSGTVTAPNKSPLEGVTVKIGALSATTDASGRYVISAIPVGSHVPVDYIMPNYILAHKVATVTKNHTFLIDVMMFPAVTATIPSSTTNTVTDGAAEIQLPANAFVDAQGNAYNGNVYVEARYFDPTNAAALAAFPGDFVGTQTNGSETPFESFGFISASFYDANSLTDELQLAAGKTSHLKVPIPASLLASAPATIPMWYYETATGKWKEQGTGTKIGDFYEGDVSHFTYWNFDHPIQVTEQSTLTGKVIIAVTDSTTDVAVGASVIATGVDYAGYTRAFSDNQGNFSLTVKAAAQVTVTAYIGINSSAPTGVITTPAVNGTASIDTLIVSDRSFTIIGNFKDAAGAAIPNGSVRLMQLNAPSGNLPFVTWLNPDASGHFNSNETYAHAGSTIQVQFNQNSFKTVLYSNPISFVVPSPGDVYDFGNITLRPGGNVTGRLKTSDNVYLSGGNVGFFQQGGSGMAEIYFNSMVGDQGSFTLEGPPSSSFNNMVGYAQSGQGSYTIAARTITFPASGQTTDIGDIIVTPNTKRK